MKIGLIQQASAATAEENRRRLAERIAEAAAAGAELVVLQELHDSLYFCQTESTGNFDLAEPVPGAATEFYGEVARRCSVVLVTSLL